jgi:hypothetical protein
MSRDDLIKKAFKNSGKNAFIAKIEDSIIFNERNGHKVLTSIPALNIALSGEVDGGFISGITVFAGKSKHYKSLFALELARAYLEQIPDSIVLFFDSEFGSPKGYFKSFGENVSRIIHIPVTTVEELRTQLLNQIEGFDRTDNVLFLIDSIGSLASEKESQDSLDGKNTVDMTRAKILKSTARLITPKLALKNIPCIVINHTYATLEMFSKDVMSGGTGFVFGADTILFIGKQQEKDGTDLLGWNFILNVEKSRFVREKEKIGILVTYADGIYKYSGVFDLAEEFGIITKPSQGWYEYNGNKTRRKDLESDPNIMEEILASDKFKQLVESKYKLFN